jgi:purine nucleosidase
MRLWIDTDIGSDVDDALALAYALGHPDLELVGVSTVFGDVELRSQIARALLERAGQADVPVLTGLGKPLAAERPGLMFGHEGLGLLDDPSPRMRTEADSEPEQRIDALGAALTEARPDVLVAIGPMTNLGALARAGLPLPRLAIMGGKVEDVMAPGMVPGIEEWNWFCDPVAVDAVLESAHETPPRVVPAEVTFKTRLAEGDVERLAEGGPLASTLSTLCGEWLVALRERFGAPHPQVALHDPLTIATLMEDALCSFAGRRIRIDSKGRTTRDDGGCEVEVAVDVDNPTLGEHLMATWLDSGL